MELQPLNILAARSTWAALATIVCALDGTLDLGIMRHLGVQDADQLATLLTSLGVIMGMIWTLIERRNPSRRITLNGPMQ